MTRASEKSPARVVALPDAAPPAAGPASESPYPAYGAPGPAAAHDCPRKRGRPRDQTLHDFRREQILDKATAVFARHGYPNTDVQFIADPLGISKGTVYRYFPSKEALFLAAVERGVLQLKRHIDHAVDRQPDPLERIVAAMRAYLEFFQANADLVELFIQERAEFRGRRTPVYFESCRTRCDRWNGMIRDLIAAGRIRPVPVEQVTDALGDLAYGIMFTNHMAGRQKPFEEQARDMIDVVFNGVLTGAERARRARRQCRGEKPGERDKG